MEGGWIRREINKERENEWGGMHYGRFPPTYDDVEMGDFNIGISL